MWLWLRVGVVVLVRFREPEGGVEEVAVGVSEGGTLTEGRLVLGGTTSRVDCVVVVVSRYWTNRV